MQYCRGSKKSKPFSRGSDFTEHLSGTFRGGFSRDADTGCSKEMDFTVEVF